MQAPAQHRIPSTSDIDPRIQTSMIEANNLTFEVDHCGDGDQLAICLHGFPEHSVSWRNQLPLLAELGYTAWAPNLRGYGNSSVPMFMEDYQIEHLMADVGALIDASGKEKVTLIAHDWGAVIAWFFAMREVRPLENLIICNVPHPAAMQRAFSFKQLAKSWYAIFFQLPGLPERMMGRGKMGEMIRDTACNSDKFSAEVVDIYNRNGSRPENMTAMVNYYRALVRGGGSKRQRELGTPVINTRTLMLWGEDDMALTVETTYGTEEFVKDFTIRYLPRISHWVQQDAPEVVNKMITAFLQHRSVPQMRWEMTLTETDAEQGAAQEEAAT